MKVDALRMLLLVPVLLAGCDVPRDPERTLEQIRASGTMYVGVIEAEPWVIKAGDQEYTGVEPELIQGFARELGAEVQWVTGPAEALFESLKHWEIDLVIGGTTDDTRWKKEIGISRPYYKGEVVVGFPPGATLMDDLEDVQVAVRLGEGLEKPVEKLGAKPVPVEDPPALPIPAAAPPWQLEAWGYRATDERVRKERHVMSAPPGENGFLTTLERYLHAHRGEVEDLLKEHAR